MFSSIFKSKKAAITADETRGDSNSANNGADTKNNLPDNTPFFIVGAPRSGTTLLRDFLRLHPRLECPEETHFFRWADPFDTYRYKVPYKNEKLFYKHRQLDGIHDKEFFEAFESVNNKKELADWYGKQYLETKENPNGRWFDKTPQNVYGILLIRATYPQAKFIHLYRNPLNVVASLLEGKVMPKQSLRAAISSWTESAMILSQFSDIAGDDLLELSYEELAENPASMLKKCLNFVTEDPTKIDYSGIETHAEKNKYEEVLNEDQIKEVILRTEPYFSLYGYNAE